ncbi:MAG TPA: hypothetical protein VG842_12955 [Sediminibacterium sp.]|nr:hypothetical protein [Sediminibacterium sp.]
MKCKQYLLISCICLMSVTGGFGQTVLHAHDQAEALIGGTWKKVTIVQAVKTKPGFYKVTDEHANSLIIAAKNIRQLKAVTAKAVTPVKTLAAKPATENTVPFAGSYAWYAGVPAMYTGKLILLQNGKYQVAFNTDENNFETGLYTYHPDTQSIEWISGIFYNNHWGGKLEKDANGHYRIRFNAGSYAVVPGPVVN